MTVTAAVREAGRPGDPGPAVCHPETQGIRGPDRPSVRRAVGRGPDNLLEVRALRPHGTHVTQHGTRQHGDAVDVVAAETVVLHQVLAAWDQTAAAGKAPEQVPPAKWDRGTAGKLVIEHAAVLVAALRECARVLAGDDHTADGQRLAQVAERMAPMVDRMDNAGRGMEITTLPGSVDFVEAVDEFGRALRSEADPAAALGVPEGAPMGDGAAAAISRRLDELLGDRRRLLHDAKWIRSHAPTQPGHRHWYDRFGLGLRLRTGYDRMRGFPWAESDLANHEMAKQYDTDIR